MPTIRPPETRDDSATVDDDVDAVVDAGPPIPSIARILALAVVVVLGLGVLLGGMVMLGILMDETHFERPTAEFDELTTEIESLPGVSAVASERWVEAPFFVEPTSWIGLTVEKVALPALLDAACATEYPDPITWSISVAAERSTTVMLNGFTPAPGSGDDVARCPDFDLDVVPLVEEIESVVPGLTVQPAVWEEGGFALVVIDDPVADYSHLLPLVENSAELATSAGFGPDQIVEINSATLGALVHPGESAAYVALLTDLIDDHGVTRFWADSGGSPTDGIEKVQLTAPDRDRAEMERLVAASGLHIADFPVRFIEE